MTEPYPLVTIRNSQDILFASEVMGRDYSVYVLLPGGYASCDARYPVIYTLDAQWDFTLLAGMVGGLMAEMLIPRAIVVGVTWPGDLESYDDLRVADFATHSVEGKPGGMENFLAFFREELIPFIDAAFRTDPSDRTLMGGSLAGFFALFGLLRDPDLFQRNVSVGPVLRWDADLIYRMEAAYAEQHRALPVRLFLAVGEWEDPVRMVEPLRRFIGILESRGYEGLQLDTMVVKEELHSSIKGEAYSRALRAVFARQVVPVDVESLQAYPGTYSADLDGGEVFTYTVTMEGNHLLGQSMYGEPPNELFPVSGSRFFSRRSPIAITFHPDIDGHTHTATLHFDDGDAPADRVDPVGSDDP